VLSTLKVRDHEVNVVGAEVVWIAELHRERDLLERYANIFPGGSIRALSSPATPTGVAPSCVVLSCASRSTLQ
jgi:hypothetical protein